MLLPHRKTLRAEVLLHYVRPYCFSSSATGEGDLLYEICIPEGLSQKAQAESMTSLIKKGLIRPLPLRAVEYDSDIPSWEGEISRGETLAGWRLCSSGWGRQISCSIEKEHVSAEECRSLAQRRREDLDLCSFIGGALLQCMPDDSSASSSELSSSSSSAASSSSSIQPPSASSPSSSTRPRPPTPGRQRPDTSISGVKRQTPEVDGNDSDVAQKGDDTDDDIDMEVGNDGHPQMRGPPPTPDIAKMIEQDILGHSLPVVGVRRSLQLPITAPSTSSSSSSSSQSSVKQERNRQKAEELRLIFGCTLDEAETALRINDGDADQAANYLMTKMM